MEFTSYVSAIYRTTIYSRGGFHVKILSKGIIIVISLFIFLSMLSSCSRVDMLNYITSRDEKDYHEMLDAVFVTLNGGDDEGLKNLFAKTVIAENPDLDKQIDDFFQVYKGQMEIETINYSTSGGEKIENGKRQTRLNNAYDIILVVGGVRYYVSMEMYSRDDFNKEAEGIHILEFDTEEAISSKYFACYNEEDDGPGLYFQHSAEKRDDIRWIEGRPWKYTYYDRRLTADDLRAVVEKDDDFNDFISIIGEPNCSWTVYAYYYYELKNGLFAVCKVEDKTNDVRPRDSSSAVIRPDVIVAIYIADEENNLETVWMADDIVEILGSYHYFLPIDRDLTEDFFKSFASRSSNLSQLEDEIGMPNVDETWYCYYKLSDNRFVECNYYGENIEKFSVVDSEHRVYTFWEAKTSID